jgi:UDP-glucose 4-epimerase
VAKVAVTGGAGFIGSNLTNHLISKGHEVIVVDDLSTGLQRNISNEVLSFHKISITEFDKLHQAIRECETIFHLAARGSVPRSVTNPTATHEVNVTGTLNVLEIARDTQAHVIFSSSSSVYGRNTNLPKDETMWLSPMSPYAASKLAGEAYVQAYAASYDMRCTILRLFNVFGPHQRPDHQYAAVLPKWIWNAIQGNSIEVYGDGTHSRDFTYIETVVNVAIAAMEKQITSEGAINLAYGNRITLNSILNLLLELFPDLDVRYKNERKSDVKESQNSPNLLYRLFPEIVPRDFEDTFYETVSWLRKFANHMVNDTDLGD